MAKVTYVGPSADIELDHGVVVERGASVDVSDDVAESLVASGDFTTAKSKRTTTTEDDQ